MTEPTLQDLRSELRWRAESVEVPPAPAFDSLRTLHESRRRLRMRRAVILSGAAAAAIAGFVFVATNQNNGPAQERPRPPVAPSSTAPPRSVADLPRGDPPATVAYVIGKRLHLGDHQLTLPSVPMSLLQAGSTVVVRLGNGDLERVDVGAGTTEHIASAPEGDVVMDSDGKYVAWQKYGTGSGHPVVLIRALDGGPERQQTIPGNPSCCDNPFMLRGITTSGQVLGEVSGDIWVWESARGSGEETVAKLRGVSQSTYISQIVGDEVVAQDGHEYYPGTIADGVFHLSDGHSYGDGSLDFGDPSGRRVVSSNGVGTPYSSERVKGDTETPADPDGVVLRLPHEADAYQLHWEDSEHFVFEYVSDVGPRYYSGALLRCDAGTGACEVAKWLNRELMLPQ